MLNILFFCLKYDQKTSSTLKKIDKLPPCNINTIHMKKLISYIIISCFVLFLSNQVYGQSKIHMTADKMPMFHGGADSLDKYMSEQLSRVKMSDSLHENLSFTVYITIEKDGRISKAISFDSTGAVYEEEAIRIIKNMPNWIPAEIDNEPVRIMISLPVHYNYLTLQNSDAEFPGGEEALMKFIKDNLNYPPKAKRNNIQGRIFVNFIIETDGSIIDVQVLRGIGYGCDEEALRVISLMPNWKPGIQNGNQIRFSYNLPILFKL